MKPLSLTLKLLLAFFICLVILNTVLKQNLDLLGFAFMIHSVVSAVVIGLLGFTKNRAFMGISLAVVALLNGYLGFIASIVILLLKPKLGDKRWVM